MILYLCSLLKEEAYVFLNFFTDTHNAKNKDHPHINGTPFPKVSFERAAGLSQPLL